MNVNQIQAMKKAGEKSVALVVWDALPLTSHTSVVRIS